MLPPLTMNNRVDLLTSYAEKVRKVHLARAFFVLFSYLKNLFISQHSFAVFHSFVRLEAAFRHFVVYVLLVRSKEKMMRIDATRHIASVKYVQSFRNIPEMEYPAYAMRLAFFCVRTAADAAVTLREACAKPNPATGLWDAFNAAENSFVKRDGLVHVSLLYKAKFTLKKGS